MLNYKMVIYSHSRLSTFEQCPLKFKFKYIEQLEPEMKETIEGYLGKKVHEALEWIYREILVNKKEFSLDEIIEYYLEAWKKDFNKGIKIVNGELDAEHYFNKGIKFLIDYFLKYSPFKDNTIAIEKKITVKLDSDGKYFLQGYIDRLVHDRGNNIFEIHDYKTGVAKTQEELNRDRQLAIYSLGIREMFENVSDVYLICHFLDLNKEMKSRRTIEELGQLKKEIIGLINRVETTTNFPPKPSCLCKWCEFRKYCPAIEQNHEYPNNEPSCKINSVEPVENNYNDKNTF